MLSKDSTLHTLAKTLADKGVVGVRLTGTDQPNEINDEGSFVAIDENTEVRIKSSESNFKEQVTIKDKKTLEIKNSHGLFILKKIDGKWPAQFISERDIQSSN